MENISLIELNESYLPQMAKLYREAFAGEPWNDDWSDTKQLNEYMKDISKAHNALNYGLLIDGKLTLIEIAPGIDLEKDILANMDFKPEIAKDLKVMDEGMFRETWGGLTLE